MKILFLTIANIDSIGEHGIYQDLMREFAGNGHHIYVVSPCEKRTGGDTRIINDEDATILKVKTGNLQKTNKIEKGVSTVLVERQFKSAIKRHFGGIKFDLVMYSTPPITFVNVIKYIKKKHGAKTYLLLKDIFPQNAVDLSLLSSKGLVYRYFRIKEKNLYTLSDYIGCMSEKNVQYVIDHNSYVNPDIVHVSPNSIEIIKDVHTEKGGAETRKKFGIPLDEKVFIYGGNLGKPQDIPFIIECLRANQNKEDRFFVICGTGTEYFKLAKYTREENLQNVLLINGLPRDEYDNLVNVCDVGLIFLDHRFTIPNFPSRLLSYMQCSMPVIACTDVNTDVGKVIEEGEFGWWCESKDPQEFVKIVDLTYMSDIKTMGDNALKYLKCHYTVSQSYDIMMNQIEKRK